MLLVGCMGSVEGDGTASVDSELTGTLDSLGTAENLSSVRFVGGLDCSGTLITPGRSY
jgi:hypothetical protein